MPTATVILRFSFLVAVVVGLPLLAAPEVLQSAKRSLSLVLGEGGDDGRWNDLAGELNGGTETSSMQTSPANLAEESSKHPSAEQLHVMPAMRSATGTQTDLGPMQPLPLTVRNLAYHQTVDQLVSRGAIGCNVEPVYERRTTDGIANLRPAKYRFRCLLRLPDSVYYRVYTAENQDPAAAAEAVLAQLPGPDSVRVTSDRWTNQDSDRR